MKKNIKTDKYKLFESFEKICGIKLINESFIDDQGNLRDLYKDLTETEINEIFRGYIECALWTEEEVLSNESNISNDNEGDEDMDEIEKLINNFKDKSFTSFVFDDIDNNSKIDAYLDIKKFIKDAGDVAIQEAIKKNDLFILGMDIWFTRNDHGSGFFDRDYDNEDILTKAGRKLGSVYLYVGDDGKLYFT